jgi:Vanillate O-demethylase oxygenase C-terminal domain
MVTFDEKSHQETDLSSLRTSKKGLQAGSGHHGPNTLATWIRFSATNSFHQYFFEAPVDENNTRIFFVNLRNCMLDPKWDAKVEEGNLRVAHEDIAVLVELNPRRTPENNVKEILLTTDQSLVRFRQWLGIWEDRGWRLNLKQLRADAGDVAYAIPSPGRRTSGNWVLDPIPLIAPSTKSSSQGSDQGSNRAVAG